MNSGHHAEGASRMLTLNIEDTEMGTHYSCAQDPAELWRTAGTLAEHIIKKKKDGQRVVLFYRGMSGIAAGTAIALVLWEKYAVEVGMVYVRKPEEKSHGLRVEKSFAVAPEGALWVFCDDFRASGATMRAAVDGAVDAGMPAGSFRTALLRSFYLLGKRSTK